MTKLQSCELFHVSVTPVSQLCVQVLEVGPLSTCFILAKVSLPPTNLTHVLNMSESLFPPLTANFYYYSLIDL